MNHGIRKMDVKREGRGRSLCLSPCCSGGVYGVNEYKQRTGIARVQKQTSSPFLWKTETSGGPNLSEGHWESRM
jgi:hypothetical protein